MHAKLGFILALATIVTTAPLLRAEAMPAARLAVAKVDGLTHATRGGGGRGMGGGGSFAGGGGRSMSGGLSVRNSGIAGGGGIARAAVRSSGFAASAMAAPRSAVRSHSGGTGFGSQKIAAARALPAPVRATVVGPGKHTKHAHSGQHHGHKAGHRGGKHHKLRGVVVYGGPAYYAYYDDVYYVDDDCAWLLRKARQTGERIWWKRYKACVEGDD